MGKNYSCPTSRGCRLHEIRVTHEGYVACAGQTDIMVAMNAETYARDVKEVAPGATSSSTSPGRARRSWKRDGGSARACAAVQRELQRRAHAHPDEEHLLRRVLAAPST
jgi:hypothetical protein